jgi:hypothetical protein
MSLSTVALATVLGMNSSNPAGCTRVMLGPFKLGVQVPEMTGAPF